MITMAKGLLSAAEQAIAAARTWFTGPATDATKEEAPAETKPDPVPEVKPEPGPSPATKPPMVAAAEASVDHTEATAKWIITILTTVSGAIIAGTQMTSFGKLDAPDGLQDARLGIAWATGVLSLVAIGFIIRQAISVLTVGDASIRDLIEDEHTARRTGKKSENLEYAYKVGVLEENQSIEQFWKKRSDYRAAEEEAQSKLHDAEVAALRDPKNEQRAIELRVAQLAAAEARERTARVARNGYVLLSALRADIVGRTMKKATVPMVIAGVLEGIFLGGFVWAVNPPDEELEPFLLPAKADIYLSPTERERYGPALGAECAASEFQGIVMSLDGETAQVVSVGSAACDVVEMELSTNALHPAEHIPLPTEPAGNNSSSPVASPDPGAASTLVDPGLGMSVLRLPGRTQ